LQGPIDQGKITPIVNTPTPSERLKACLDRIDRDEATVRAFKAMSRDNAIAAARASDLRWAKAEPLSPIDGLVVGLKDVIETADMPTGQGSPIFEGVETGRDAACVQALRAAGAVILGKTTTTEFAVRTPLHATRNPHDLARTPGGSSSGSAAAVTAGFVEMGLGTQVLGSILRPASFCGCVGYKPSYGAINRAGLYDYLSQSCIGFIGRSVTETWSTAIAISERVGGDAGHRGLTGPQAPPEPVKPRALAAIQTGGWRSASAGAKAAFEAACDRLRQAGVTVSDRNSDPALEAFEQAIQDITLPVQDLMDWEMRWPLATYRRLWPGRVSQVLIDRLAVSERKMTLAGYHALLDWREGLRARFAEFAGVYDGFVALSATGAAPLGHDWSGDPAMNEPASTLGAPAIGLPVLEDEGLPLGLQLFGYPGRDRELLEFAEWTGRSLGLAFRTAER